MNVYSFLINENKKYIHKMIILFILYILYVSSEIYLFSYLISCIIKSFGKNISYINNIFKYIIIGLLLYLSSYYIYRYVHINTMVNMRVDIRRTLFNLIIKSNDNKFIDKNYPKFHSSINRFSLTSFIVFNHLSTYIYFYSINITI